jgi:CO dehydrogenase maturation factor
MSETQVSATRLVSVCGKGGTGKTVFTAMMTRALLDSRRAGKLLVIDADPALGQLSALGARVRRTMGQIREDIIRTARRGNKDEKAEITQKLDYMVFEALSEMDGFALLAMGRTESLGCFCPVNSLLRTAIGTLSRSFDTILVDGEAGLEQINRQVTQRLDTLIILSDPSSRGLETAAVIKDMVEREKIIDCGTMGIVFNRVAGNETLLRQAADRIGVRVLGWVPQDATIAAYDLAGRPITELPADCPGLTAVRGIIDACVLGPAAGVGSAGPLPVGSLHGEKSDKDLG